MNRKLPAWTCIRHAISSVRNNLPYAFRISWPWYAVMAPLIIGLVLLSTYVTAGNPESNKGATAAIDFIRGLITMVAFASIAVNWHRYILLDEIPRSSEVYRLDDKTWRYFGNMLLLILILVAIGFVIGFPIGFIAGAAKSLALAVAVTILIVVPVAGVTTLRLGTKFPAIALGRRDFSMRSAWAATADNNLPIFLVILFEVAAFFAIIVAISAIAYFTNMVSATLTIVVTVILGLIVNWLFTIFSITVLTSLYGFFVEDRDF